MTTPAYIASADAVSDAAQAANQGSPSDRYNAVWGAVRPLCASNASATEIAEAAYRGADLRETVEFREQAGWIVLPPSDDDGYPMSCIPTEDRFGREPSEAWAL